MIKDANDKDILKVKMRGKSFALNPLEEEQIAFSVKEKNTKLWNKKQKVDEDQVSSEISVPKVLANCLNE